MTLKTTKLETLKKSLKTSGFTEARTFEYEASGGINAIWMESARTKGANFLRVLLNDSDESLSVICLSFNGVTQWKISDISTDTPSAVIKATIEAAIEEATHTRRPVKL